MGDSGCHRDDLLTVVSGAITAAATSSQLAVVPTNKVDNLDAVQLAMDRDDVTVASQRYQSRGVTADASAVTAYIPVAESMLTLLMQLFRRFSRAGVYRLSLLAGVQSAAVTEARVGDAEFYIRKVLDRVCAESTECAEFMRSQSQHLTPDGSTTQQNDTQQEDKDERHDFGFAV